MHISLDYRVIPNIGAGDRGPGGKGEKGKGKGFCIIKKLSWLQNFRYQKSCKNNNIWVMSKGKRMTPRALLLQAKKHRIRTLS